MLGDPVVSVLGKDPARKHRINANSFQGNAITTVNGWQYAALYTGEGAGEGNGACFVNLARRQALPPGTSREEWQTFLFGDYEQTVDDGHNTISIGVSRGDGTVHVAFDHHCDQLRFRISKRGVANTATSATTAGWDASMFSETQNFLPGIPSNDLMREVTYPRFVNIDDDLLLTYRIGQAGTGSDILYRYSSTTHRYTYLGQYLTGVSNSPYINGLDYRDSRIHVSWCYRNFVPFDASAGPESHKQQAGPNGPENNYDLNYAYSDDKGATWKGSGGMVLARLGSEAADGESTIKPGADGARVFEIPMKSGILNQESQAVSRDGSFWALNRERVDGDEKWIAYYRDVAGHWTKKIIRSHSQPTETGSRGSVCVDRENNVYLVLPGNSDSSLDVMQARRDEEYAEFRSIWRGDGFDGEPLVDVQRLEASDVLSIFTRTSRGERGSGDVVVLDFTLPGQH